jgi:hypothetical protein
MFRVGSIPEWRWNNNRAGQSGTSPAAEGERAVVAPVRSAATWVPRRAMAQESCRVPPWCGPVQKQMDNRRQRPQSRRMDIRIQCLCIDTTDPLRLATFWQAALGWRLEVGDENEAVLEPPKGSPEDGVAPDLLFLSVPGDKLGKNRLHLDLRPVDQAAEVARLEGLGARRVDVGQGPEVTWVVLADPDGNEFCVLRALRPEELAGD